MKSNTSKLFLSLVTAILASPVLAEPRSQLDIRPLATTRDALKPTAYTAAQRELMAKQALMFIKDLYVHRELKITDFGAGADPVPRLEDMVRRAASMSDADYHLAMQKIFIDLHDHHTNYMAPMPLRCSYALAPLDFTDVYDGGSLKVIVKGRTSVLEKFSPEASKAAVGDELIAINDKPIASLMPELRKWSGGANEDAMITGAIMNLSMIPLAEQPIPADNDIKYTLKRGATTYTISSKYYAAINIPGCAEEVEGSSKRKTTHSDMLRAENPNIRVYRDLVAQPSVEPFSEEGKLPDRTFLYDLYPGGQNREV